MLSNKAVQKTQKMQEKICGGVHSLKDYLLAGRLEKWIKRICETHEKTSENLSLNYFYFFENIYISFKFTLHVLTEMLLMTGLLIVKSFWYYLLTYYTF